MALALAPPLPMTLPKSPGAGTRVRITARFPQVVSTRISPGESTIARAIVSKRSARAEAPGEVCRSVMGCSGGTLG